MISEILLDEPIEKIIDDWDFFDERILGRFSTFQAVGQNIFGIRARTISMEVIDPKKGRLDALVLGPNGIEQITRTPMLMHLTAGGVPHHVRHSFGYWHINDMDELLLAIPAAPGEKLGRTVILMQKPTGSEGESFAWYCDKCLTLLHEYHYDTGRDGFEGFWRAEGAAVQRYNSDARHRTCPECGYANPLGYCWNMAKDKPEESEARALW